MDSEYLPATGNAEQDLVLLHGWGSTREVWRPLLARLRPWANVTLLDLPGCAPGLDAADDYQLEDLLRQVLAAAPQRAVYLGWSLGGQLAIELAAQHAPRVAAVVTVCSNPCFVAQPDWPGMDSETFAGFRSACCADPVTALRRFGSLQVQGARRPRAILRQLQRYQQGRRPGPRLTNGLAWLAQLDQRATLPTLQQPQLHMLTKHDGLVPSALEPALSAELRDTLTAQVRMVVGGASHMAPIEVPTELAAGVREFLGSAALLRESFPTDSGPDKKDVAHSFSRAAPTYDSVAQLQREVGKGLLTRLPDERAAPAVVLDLGCGTGSFRSELRAHYPRASYIGLDLAPGMVEYARAGAADDSLWVVGDAESLPLASDSVDLVFSSLAIQWCHKPALIFAELLRVLRPGGRCLFTTLGPGTLAELRQSWAAVDGRRHVNSFLPAGELMSAAGLVPGIRLALASERYTMQYTRVGELLNELKTLGAHNMNRDRPTGLTSRRTLLGMLQAYEAWRNEGLLPATYDVIFGEVEKT
jgi:malonyl-CoA O-methyltransferase